MFPRLPVPRIPGRFAAALAPAAFVLALSCTRLQAIDSTDLRPGPIGQTSSVPLSYRSPTAADAATALDRTFAREELERLHLAGSSSGDKALSYGILLAIPLFLLFIAARFARSA